MQPISKVQSPSKFWKFSFPVISIFLGLFVGAYNFSTQSKNVGEYPGQQIFKPVGFGLTTTYLVLSVGLNLKLAKDRKAKRKLIKL